MGTNRNRHFSKEDKVKETKITRKIATKENRHIGEKLTRTEL